MASVGGDDSVVLVDSRLHSDSDGLLLSHQRFETISPREANKNELHENWTDLSDSQMTEPSDLLGLVERIGSHLHPPHSSHVGVHLDEQVLGDLDVGRGSFAAVAVEAVSERREHEQSEEVVVERQEEDESGGRVLCEGEV